MLISEHLKAEAYTTVLAGLMSHGASVVGVAAYLIASANFTEEAGRGAFSVRKLADSCHLSTQEARTCLRRIADSGLVTFTTSNAKTAYAIFSTHQQTQPAKSTNIQQAKLEKSTHENNQDKQNISANNNELDTAEHTEATRINKPADENQQTINTRSEKNQHTETPELQKTPAKSDVPPTGSRVRTRPALDVNNNLLLSPPVHVPPFDTFWAAYPKKVGKGFAKKSFARAIKKTKLSTMLEAIEKAKRSEQWTKDGGQFIPHPATWLNQERWDDELALASPAAGNKTNRKPGNYAPPTQTGEYNNGW